MKNSYLFLCLMLATLASHAQPCTFTPTFLAPNSMVINPPAGYPTSNYNFHWDFGDGSSINTNTPSHIYYVQGTYTVNLTVYDNITSAAVCSSSSTFTLTFCDIHFEQDTLSPADFNFWATLIMGNTGVWNFGDGNTSTADSVSHTYSSPGTYTVSFTQSDPQSNVICMDSFMVAYNPSVACAIDVSQPNPTGNPAYFALHALVPSSEGTIMWDYDIGTGPTPGGLDVSVAYGDSGYKNICMYYTNGSYSCQSCTTIYVNPQVNCSFTNSLDPFNPNLMHFSASNLTAGTQYFWNFGDGTMATGGPNISHQYAVGNFYYVCMEVQDSLTGNTLCTYCNYVAANPNNYTCTAGFTSVSLGLTAYFINQASAFMPSPVTYAWDFGDGYTAAQPFPQHQYALPGTYNVCLNISAQGCSDTYCDSVTVDTTIVNPVGCNAYFVFTQTASYQVVGVNLSSGTNLSFAWDFGDGTTATGPYPTHQYTTIGTYVVCLTVTDQASCTSTYCDTLTVDANGNIIYKGFSVGFVLSIVSPAQITGVNNTEGTAGLNVYPVPAADHLYVDLKLTPSANTPYEIINITGEKVLTGTLRGKHNSINIHDLTKGVYLLRTWNTTGGQVRTTFVKQ